MTFLTENTDFKHGILEELENCINYKLNFIHGLLNLRSSNDESHRNTIKEICDSFADTNELINDLSIKVEYEQKLCRFLAEILKANELQKMNLTELMKTRNSQLKKTQNGGRTTDSNEHSKCAANGKIGLTRLKSLEGTRFGVSKLKDAGTNRIRTAKPKCATDQTRTVYSNSKNTKKKE